MNMTRALLSSVESVGLFAAVLIAAEGHWIVGYFIALFVMMLAYIEGRAG